MATCSTHRVIIRPNFKPCWDPKMCAVTWCTLNMFQSLAWWWPYESKHVATCLIENKLVVFWPHFIFIFSNHPTFVPFLKFVNLRFFFLNVKFWKVSKRYRRLNLSPKYCVVQCKIIIEIRPCRGAFPDSLTIVQHVRKGVPRRTHKACFNIGRNIKYKVYVTSWMLL